MPRLNRVEVSDPLNIWEPIRIVEEPHVNARSVLDNHHPDNNRQRDGGRDYTFRLRNAPKLKFTLGWELEANHAPTFERIPRGVEQIGDGSVNGDGAEFVVLPAVTKSPRYVLGLLKELVHAPNLNTDESCGFHVHVSASNVPVSKMRQWAQATEYIGTMIEDMAFKAVPESRKGNQYCRRIQPLYDGARFVSSKYSNERRYQWLNTVEMFRPNGIRTIENRLLGHTHRWKYVLAWSLFTLELGRQGWETMHKPFQAQRYADTLRMLLERIITEIKPLDRRHEPVPQWVYNGLMEFGIDISTWSRPLSKLVETEYKLNGRSVPFYSDNQPEIPNHEDEDSDYCPCGCDTEGRCDSQLHSDGDCDSNYCDYCHEDGNCSGSPRCERCLDNAHDNGEDCGRNTCSTCGRPNTRINSSGTVTGRTGMTLTGTNLPSSTSQPLTADAMRQAVNQMRNMTIDNTALTANPMHYYTIHDANFYGQSITHMVLDEFNHLAIDPALEANLEYRAHQMLDAHESALSVNREMERGTR